MNHSQASASSQPHPDTADWMGSTLSPQLLSISQLVRDSLTHH
jgi:hypothetical protein